MSLSTQLPNNLEQQLSVYCQEHRLSINETVRLALSLQSSFMFEQQYTSL